MKTLPTLNEEKKKKKTTNPNNSVTNQNLVEHESSEQ